MENDLNGSNEGGQTLWHGRFEGGPAEALMAYTVSLPFDRTMWRDDIQGSQAHVRGLARGELLSEEERDAILAALDQVADELAGDSFAGSPRSRARRAGNSTPRAAATIRSPPTCGCGANAS